jgi:hypothetical protein
MSSHAPVAGSHSKSDDVANPLGAAGEPTAPGPNVSATPPKTYTRGNPPATGRTAGGDAAACPNRAPAGVISARRVHVLDANSYAHTSRLLGISGGCYHNDPLASLDAIRPRL